MQFDHAERRVYRSDQPLQALGYFLEAARRRARVRSLALADAGGILLAGAGSARECDELAAFAPLAPAERDASAPVCTTLRLTIGGLDAFLCAEGEDAEFGLLADAAAGCIRILRAA